MEKRKKGEEERRLEAQRLKALEDERNENFEKLQQETKENSLRKAILADSVDNFEKLLSKVRDHKVPIRAEENWKKFLKCSPIPNTQIPSEVRSFLYKFQLDFENYFDHKINWWLFCDERSDMHQDTTRHPDVRRKLVDKIRKPIGSFYDSQVRLLMKAYESLEDSIRCKKVSKTRLNDLIKLQEIIRETALKFLDVLTLEIISSIDREMKPITPLISTYAYTSSQDFIKFIWSFKDVTLPQNRDKLRGIKLDPLRMSITVSNALDMELSAVRGLWIKRDFFSDFCPTFNPLHEMEYVDLAKAVESEMEIRRQLTQKHLDEMRQKREEYDKKMEALAKEESKKKNQKVLIVKKDEKKNKKPEIEPQIVDEKTYINVDDEYVQLEDLKAQEEMEKLSPENLNISENEINMREYQVLGGVYKVECLLKPVQTKEINFQMFIRLNEIPNVLQYTPFSETYTPPKQLKRHEDERRSQFNRKVEEMKQKALANLFKIQLKLPDKVIFWEMPQICRWEPWEESDEFNDLDESIRDFNLNHEKYAKEQQQKLFKSSESQYKKKLAIEDLKLSAYPEKIKLSTLVRDYLASMIPEEISTYDEAVECYEAKQLAWKRHVDVSKARNEEKLSLEEFKKLFSMRKSSPNVLFPVEISSRIKVIENLEEFVKVQIEREKKFEENLPPYKIDISENFPMRNEPLMLSELIERLTNFRKQPKFKSSEIIEKIEKPKEKKIPKKVGKVRRKSLRRKRRKSAQRTSDDVTTISDGTKSESTGNKLIPHHKGKWSTRDIHEQSYDEEEKVITFYAGRLGNFGLAVKKFINLPLKNWEMFPVFEDKMEKFILMKVEGQSVSIDFKITKDGYTFKIIKPLKAPIPEIKNPVKVYELKKILTSMNINLFPEVDSSWYIQNSSEKHRPLEFHTYKCMAAFCLSHVFLHEKCNHQLSRRNILIKYRQADKKFCRHALVTPLRTVSVKMKTEKCAEGMNEESIYIMDPLDQEFMPDLLNFLKNQVDITQQKLNQQNFMLIWYTQALLMNLRPFSFSE